MGVIVNTIKPFLKWAGGKRWLVDRNDFHLPHYTARYIEPFVGGGAMFFSTLPQSAILSDMNTRLIETYQAIQERVDLVVESLVEHQKLHSKEYYYSIRSQKFANRTDRAAQFLYLNRTCWNGLYRENLRGEFNVPIGTKTKVIDDDEDLMAVSEALKNATLLASDFESTLDLAGPGDLVFADPPYTTAHNFNGFVKYNEKVFAWADQIRLRDAAIRARDRGAKVLITNAHHPSIFELYDGFGTIEEVTRRSVISGKAAGRIQTSECLIWM